MKLAKLAGNNLRRTPARSVLTAVSVLIATATLTVVLSVDRGYSKAVERDLVEKPACISISQRKVARSRRPRSLPRAD